MTRSIYTDGSRPEHLADKYRVYVLRFNDGGLIKVHVGRPVSFKTFCESFILQHMELINQRTSTIFDTSQIVGIEKVPNNNRPDFEVTMEGQLLDIP